MPNGTKWPVSDYVSAALIPIASETLSKVVGVPLTRGVESGLGSWEAVGLRLESGALVELIRYEIKEAPSGFEVRVAGDSDVSVTLHQVLALLNIAPESLVWVSPCIRA